MQSPKTTNLTTPPRQFLLNAGLVGFIVSLPLMRFLWDLGKGFDFIIYHYLADDAFYYFEISRHIPEFNEGIPNSGFHPLFAFIIAPLHSSLDPYLAIPLSLAILVIANCIVVFIIYRLMAIYWQTPIPIVCAAAWALSPLVYSLTLSGLETILAVMFVLLFFLQFSTLIENSFHSINSLNLKLSFMGVTVGLAFLARMDSPLILAPAIVFLIYRLIKSNKMNKSWFLLIPAITLPMLWIAFINFSTGKLYPTSGSALRVLRGLDDRLFAMPEQILRSLRFLGAHIVDYFVIVPKVAEVLLLAILVIGGFAALWFRRRTQTRKLIRFELLVLIGLSVWASYYILYQGGFRSWYLLYPAIGIFTIYLPLVLDGIFSLGRTKDYSRKLAGVVSLILISIIVLFSTPPPLAPQEYDKYQAAIAANRFVSEMNANGRIGALNTGIYDYFLEMDVINLDGFVNPGALEAIQKGRMPEYLLEMNIKYLIEHDIGDASNADFLFENPRIKIVKWKDLTSLYAAYQGTYERETYLWKLEVNDE